MKGRDSMSGRADLSGNVGDQIQSHIGDRLKTFYDSVLNEPVPDKFMDLLSQLDVQPGGRDTRER